MFTRLSIVGLRGIKPFVVAGVLAGLSFNAIAQDNFNARAMEDLKLFMAKFEEGDTLFHQKKYAEAAAALAAAHDLYLRADQRDGNSTRMRFSIATGKFPALRYFGYGFGPNPSLSETPAGAIEGSAEGFHMAQTEMWMDAAILGGLDKFPSAGVFKEPELVEMSESELGSLMSTLYGPVSTFKLPVPDSEWRNVVLWSRRAQLMVEFALQKFPAWKTATLEWSSNNNKLQHTGDEALADIRTKLAEAEPEYAKVVADAKNAAPQGAKQWIGRKVEDLDKAIAGVKQNGWIEWNLARDIFISKNYIAEIRKSVAKLYADEGKTMPADALKLLEDKVVALQAAVEQSAAKWKFPSGKPKNATLEAKAAAAVKARLSGSTILQTGMDTGEWTITKNDVGIPMFRSTGVNVLVKIPGQKHAWLVFGYVRQEYSGGGTYAAGGTYVGPSDIRIQAGG